MRLCAPSGPRLIRSVPAYLELAVPHATTFSPGGLSWQPAPPIWAQPRALTRDVALAKPSKVVGLRLRVRWSEWR